MVDKALILVDFEKEWLDKNSKYYLGDISKILHRTNKLIDFCRKHGYKIIFIQHVEKDSKDVFAAGSEKVEIIPELHRKKQDVLIAKYKISSFYETTLDRELKGITKIVVAGLITNLCVRSLVQDAYDRGFSIVVIKDCCTTFDEKVHEFTVKDLQETREEIKFMTLNPFTS